MAESAYCSAISLRFSSAGSVLIPDRSAASIKMITQVIALPLAQMHFHCLNSLAGQKLLIRVLIVIGRQEFIVVFQSFLVSVQPVQDRRTNVIMPAGFRTQLADMIHGREGR